MRASLGLGLSLNLLPWPTPAYRAAHLHLLGGTSADLPSSLAPTPSLTNLNRETIFHGVAQAFLQGIQWAFSFATSHGACICKSCQTVLQKQILNHHHLAPCLLPVPLANHVTLRLGYWNILLMRLSPCLCRSQCELSWYKPDHVCPLPPAGSPESSHCA